MTLRGLGVQPYFPVIVTGDDAHEAKPSPKVPAEAVDRIGTLPDRTLCWRRTGRRHVRKTTRCAYGRCCLGSY
jgi:hypothetical protein